MFLIFRLRTNINIRIKGFKISKETKEEKITNDKDKVSSDYDDFFDDFFFEE